MHPDQPAHLDLTKDRGLAIRWSDGSSSYYSIAFLRRMSPSADMRQLREAMDKNPLTVLPSNTGRGSGGGDRVTVLDAELVGNYALRLVFSDGHSTGLYTWSYLREIDPRQPGPDDAGPDDVGPDAALEGDRA